MKYLLSVVLGILYVTSSLLGEECLVGTSRIFQIENEHVRVWRSIVMPHVPLKAHRHDSIRIIVGLKGGVLTRVEDTGERIPVEYETGKAYWIYPDPVGTLHTEINETEALIEVMVIELKNFDILGDGSGIDFEVRPPSIAKSLPSKFSAPLGLKIEDYYQK